MSCRNTPSDEQALINNVVQLRTGSIKGHASLTFGAAVMTEGRAPSATRRNRDRLAVEIQRYSLLSFHYPLEPHTYTWNAHREVKVCFHCKHLNAGSSELSQHRWAETGQRSLALFHFQYETQKNTLSFSLEEDMSYKEFMKFLIDFVDVAPLYSTCR